MQGPENIRVEQEKWIDQCLLALEGSLSGLEQRVVDELVLVEAFDAASRNLLSNLILKGLLNPVLRQQANEMLRNGSFGRFQETAAQELAAEI